MTDDGDRVPSPEETLRVIEQQRAATARALQPNPARMYVPWGVAWLLGFTAFFLHYGLHGVSYAPISQMQALAVLMVAQIVAGSVMAYEIVRMSAHTRGDNQSKGTMYGYTWFVGMTLMILIALRVSPLLPPDQSGLLWAGGTLTVVAILYMAGGAVWLQWPMFFVGAWIAGVNGLGVTLGAGWHSLLTAVLLGGGQIAIGLWLRRRS